MKKRSLDALERPDIETFKSQKKEEVVIILDNVRSLHNVGSIFRTADAFSIAALYLCGITGKPPHKEIHKTALGATESVYWQYFEKISDAINYIKSKGYTVYIIEQTDASMNLIDFMPQENTKMAFVFGNEVHGVSDEALEQADYALEIPQLGTKHSFNVAVCTGIILWDYFIKTKSRH